jgi:hypothetical protein
METVYNHAAAARHAPHVGGMKSVNHMDDVCRVPGDRRATSMQWLRAPEAFRPAAHFCEPANPAVATPCR